MSDEQKVKEKTDEVIKKQDQIQLNGGNLNIRNTQALFAIARHLNRIATTLENNKK